jgi:hypothetical protein
MSSILAHRPGKGNGKDLDEGEKRCVGVDETDKEADTEPDTNTEIKL